MVRKLEDFLTQNENSVCEVNTKLSLEGLQLNLFLDSEEVARQYSPSILLLVAGIYTSFRYTFSGVELTGSRLESRPVQANVW